MQNIKSRRLPQNNTPKNCQKSKVPGWALSDLYKSIKDPQIEKDLETYKRQNKKLAKDYKGKIAALSSDDFYKSLQLVEKNSVLGSKLAVFAYLNMVTQMKNQEAVAFYQNIDEKMTEYSKP